MYDLQGESTSVKNIQGHFSAPSEDARRSRLSGLEYRIPCVQIVAAFAFSAEREPLICTAGFAGCFGGLPFSGQLFFSRFFFVFLLLRFFGGYSFDVKNCVLSIYEVYRSFRALFGVVLYDSVLGV